MRFKKVQIRSAGPLRDRTIRFQDVNLVVGNNEEGKTTLMDILIQRLLSGPYAKSVSQDRFNLDNAAEVETEGRELAEDAVRLQSLFVIREGDTRWKGRDAKNRDDIRRREIWNDEIKEILHGNDPVYAALQAGLGPLLGVAKKNSWLSQWEANVRELAGIADRQAAVVDGLRRLGAEIAKEKQEIEKTGAEMAKLAAARKNRAGFEKLGRLDRYFRFTDECRELEDKIRKLEDARLESVRTEWSELEEKLSDLDKRSARIGEQMARLADAKRDREKRRADHAEKLETIRREKADAEIELEKIRERKKIREDAFRRSHPRFDEKKSRFVFRFFQVLTAALFAVELGTIVVTVLTLLKFMPQVLDFWYYPVIDGGIFLAGIVALLLAVVFGRSSERARAERDAIELEFAPLLAHFSEKISGQSGRLAETVRELETPVGAGDEDKRNALDAEREKTESERKALLEKQNGFLRVHGSADSVVARLRDLDNDRKSLAACRKELSALEQDMLRDWGTVSISALRDATDKLRRELETEGRDAAYSEEHYRDLEKQKDALNESVRRKSEDQKETAGAVVTAVDHAVAGASRGIKPEYLDRFYPDRKTLGLSGDVFNIFAFGERVRSFAARVTRDRESAEKLSDAFDSVQSRLDALVDAVLGTEHFRRTLSRITNGTYTAVEAKIGDDRLELFLKHRDGSVYSYDTLSTGARNQFHIAFRLALAKDRFGSEPGVFLLDDAFLSFDADRRRSAVELLSDWSREGWQIIYATVNEGGMSGVFDSVFGKSLHVIALEDKS